MSILFNKKNAFICWTRLKTAKLLATAKQLMRKNSICCLNNQVIFFHKANVQISLATPLPCLFLFAFVPLTPTPPPHPPHPHPLSRRTYFLNAAMR